MSSTYKRLLIVDDDANILRLIKKIFEKTYDLRVAKSPNEGLKLIEEGFKPGVILSDQIMPHMSGAEFLNLAIRHIPTAVKIIMTGHTETADIIQCVNEAKAHMYITKPFNTIDLVQAVKMCFEHHKSLDMNQSVGTYTKDLASKQGSLNKQIEAYKQKLNSVKNEIVSGYRLLAINTDRLSYIDHTDFVTALVKDMCKRIQFRSDIEEKIISTAKIHSGYKCTIPDHISIKLPMNLSKGMELETWIDGFNNFISSLRATGLMDREALLIQTMFENKIGTGMPNQIDEAQFHKDHQVLSIANRYANEVYGLLPEDYEHTNRVGPWEQTESETLKRHDDLIYRISSKRTWYDEVVINSLIAALETEELKPKKGTLRIE